jgi:DNA-binding beta-propeller fold protein YncE
MRLFYSAGCLLSVSLFTLSSLAQLSGTLLVANQKDRTISVINTATAEQTSIQEDRITGHEVATSPDGRTAYVPIYGSSGVGHAGTDGHEMLVLDIGSRKISGVVDFGHPVRPHLPVYDSQRDVLYVTTELDQAITAIDPHSLKILYTIPTGQAESHMLALSHDGRFGYTANVGPGTVSILDLKKHKTAAVVSIATHVQRISISNDDKLIFTSDSSSPRLALLDTATRKLKTWIQLPAQGYGSAPTRDGRFLILAMPSASKVAVIDLTTLTIARTIDVPKAPQEVLIRPDGLVAYVSCNSSHQVAAIDLSNWKTTLFEAGNGADGLAWASSPQRGTASNKR